MLSVAEAQTRVLEGVAPLASESVALERAAGRVLSTDLTANVTNPPCDVSAMDGYAVRSSDTNAPGATLRVVGVSSAGDGFGGHVDPGCAVRIFTGAPVPPGADGVLIQENTARSGDFITLLPDAAILPGRHVRPAGLDFKRGQRLLFQGTRLASRHTALAAAMNHASLPCVRRPRVAILATGNELVPPGGQPAVHQILSSTPYGLMHDIENWGGEAVHLGIALDTVDDIRAKIHEASACDVLITIGGASVGDYDLVQKALAPELDLNFWKIAMRPGKPLIFGTYRGARLLGLPGNPVSAFVCAHLFLKPLVYALSGATDEVWSFARATLDAGMPENDSRQEYSRTRLLRHADGRIIAQPLPVQDSSMLSFLSNADGLIVRPPHDPALTAGQSVTVLTF